MLTTGCSEQPDYSKIVDAVLAVQDEVHQTVVSNPMTWTTPSTEGLEIGGTLEGVGSVDVKGWRLDKDEVASTGLHRVFGEKLFFKFNNYAALDVNLNGSVVTTTHSLDFGQTDAAYDNLNESNSYVGVLTVGGALEGSFQIDVNGMTTNNVPWSCGTVNGEPYGAGKCY